MTRRNALRARLINRVREWFWAKARGFTFSNRWKAHKQETPKSTPRSKVTARPATHITASGWKKTAKNRRGQCRSQCRTRTFRPKTSNTSICTELRRVLNDRIETKAIKNAFGEHAYKVPMSGTKSQIGHPQGASGAAGIGAALLALNKNIIPPTINLDEPDENCDLNYTPNKSIKADVKTALCNCIGFGSKNSALVLGKVF